MSLQIYAGRSGAARTAAILKEMIRRSMTEPDRRFFVIVPEQSTMETQKKLVSLHPRRAILNLEVTSLNRLAYRVFSELGLRGEAVLEEIGKTFLLEKIALEKKNELPYLGRNLTRPEFLAEMKSLVSELMLYDVTPELLAETLQAEGGTLSGELRAKLADVLAVYRAYEEKLAGNWLVAEAVPDRFCRLAEQSELLRGSVLSFDGFTGFTPVQYRLLEQLLPLVQDLLVTAAVDTPEHPGAKRAQTDLFSMGFELVRKLRELARATGTEFLPPVLCEEDETGETRPAELAFLEKMLFRRKAAVYAEECGEALSVCEARNPREETEAIAAEICRLVREEGLRYRDIAVVTGDPATYGIYASEIMQEYEIPYFVDEKRPLLRNPLIEYLRAALEACTDNYSFGSMFRMLKSGMTELAREEIEHLENYALGTGLRGKKNWRRTFVYHYRGQDPAEVPMLEVLRKRVLELLDPLSAALAERGGTVRDKAEAVYRFCAASHAEEKLLAARDRYSAEGRPDLAREYAQVYPYVCGFLDKLVAVLGEEQISMRDFRALLEAGFAEARVAIIPPGHDRVLIGDVERSRLGDVKVLFFAGVNEGLVPRIQDAGGMLTDHDRERLLGLDERLSLKPTVRQAIYIERFYLYSILTKPTERLILSYSRNSCKGDSLSPSYLVDTVCRLFPGLRIRKRLQGTEVLPERKAAGLALLAEGLSRIPAEPLGPAWQELYLLLRSDPMYAERTRRLMTAASERRTADQIGRAAARKLYGTMLVNSASRLEYFAGCAFAHFMLYGLRLKERPDYVFSGMDFGNIMHRSLELFGSSVRGQKIREGDFSGPEMQERLEACLMKAAEEAGSGSALYATARDRYRLEKMRRLLAASVDTMGRQLAAGDFRVHSVEQNFRTGGDLRSLNFELPDGTRMQLTGRIDRIDTCTDGDVTYYKIVDFKTGYTKWDPALVYYGLELQLAIYANAAAELLRREGRLPVPAGMFYQRVQDPVLKFEEGERAEELVSRRLRETIGTGVVLEEQEVLRHLDTSFYERGKSDVIPVSLLKNGNLSASSNALSSEELALIGEYARMMAGRAGAEIMEGRAEVSPYRYKQKNFCTYCKFRDCCGFDQLIPGCRFRELESLSAKQALELMAGALGKPEEEKSGV